MLAELSMPTMRPPDARDWAMWQVRMPSVVMLLLEWGKFIYVVEPGVDEMISIRNYNFYLVK
jgi:hypothetical protein